MLVLRGAPYAKRRTVRGTKPPKQPQTRDFAPEEFVQDASSSASAEQKGGDPLTSLKQKQVHAWARRGVISEQNLSHYCCGCCNAQRL